MSSDEDDTMEENHDKDKGGKGKSHKEVQSISKSSKRRLPVGKKYIMLPPCKRLKCSEKISDAERKLIFDEFWKMSKWDDRMAWMYGAIDQTNKLCDTVAGKRSTTREKKRTYKLKVNVIVCKDMFLWTLGYNYDTVVTKIPTSTKPVKEKRGKHKPKRAFSQDMLAAIDDHIESFKPMISNYRRAHASLCWYLPPELSPKVMYGHFCESNPGMCCGETYRLRLKKKNIGFGQLGEEECEVCVANIHHQCNAGLITESRDSIEDHLAKVKSGVCEECDAWILHILRANKSREAYRKDADTYPTDNVFYVSADMQKVIMLPRWPGLKTAVFTWHIILYHETYAPLIPSKETKKKWKEEKRPRRQIKPLGIIWHEGIQGRYDEDVSSTVLKCLHDSKYQEAREMVIWADNCVGQLKNWTLYSTLVHEVNIHGNISNIRIKYFKKGHTFLSADSYHSQVERAMREKKHMYDFRDFVECVSKYGTSLEMTAGDFYDSKNQLSTAKDTNYPLQKDVR